MLAGSTWLVLRRLRFEPAPALTMFVLVVATCFLFAALPRLFNTFADDGLRYSVGHAPLSARNVREVEENRVAVGAADPLALVASRAARSQQALPESLRRLIARQTFVVRSTRYYAARSAPSVTRFLTLSVQSGASSHIRLVAGRLPGPSTARTRVVDRRIPELPQRKHVPLVQVALSTATARELGLRVGNRLVFLPDPGDIAVSQLPMHDEQPLAVEVTGLFVVKDPQSTFWFGDKTLDVPVVQQAQDLSTKLVFGQALVSAGEYANVLAATRPLPLAYEYRYFVDASRLDAGGLGRLGGDVARIDARYAGAGPLERRVETGLGSVIADYRAARSQAETLLAVAAIGLLACALACLGLVGALTYERRRADTGVSRTRGASPPHVLAAQTAEGLLIAVPAGLLGWALAVSAIGGRGSDLSGWLVLATVAATVLLLVAAIIGVARRPLQAPAREDVVAPRPSSRRLAMEALVAIAALLGVYLLRRRGLETSGAGAGASFDPYLAGVPVLLGLVCGIIALRLYPLPIRGAARLSRRGRGLAIHFGLSRAGRQPDLTALPLVVLVLALAIATFSASMLSTLEAGQNRTGWSSVGADLRVDAAADESLPAGLVARLSSTGEVARAYVQEADVGPEGSGPTSLLIVLDVAAYQRVVAGTPIAVGSLGALTKPSPLPSIVPALLSDNWPTSGFFPLTVSNEAVNFAAVAEPTATFPGVPQGTPFAVVSLRALERAGAMITPNRLYLRNAATAAVRQAVRETAPDATLRSRGAIVSGLRASPLVESVLRGFRWAIVLAALYAAVAVGLMTLIAARSRSRDLALVRTMGGSRREGIAVSAVELTPFVLVALVLGIGLGLAIPYLIEPGLDLAFYTGNGTNPITTNWLPVIGFAAGLLVLIGAAVLLAGVRMRRAQLNRVLRIGER
jgi:putative ABC transport system permease protein